MSSFINVQAVFLTVTEFCSFDSLLTLGIAILLGEKRFIVAVIGYSGITIFYFVICTTNERIKSKLNDIYEAVYDLPWYNMTVKDRKMVLLMLNCKNIQATFVSGKVYKIGHERFLAVVQTTYSYLLIIKEFLI